MQIAGECRGSRSLTVRWDGGDGRARRQGGSYVTDKTLAKLETGDGSVRLETLAMALLVLGELHRLGEMLDPAKDDTGLILDQARLPSAGRSATARARPDEIDDEGSAF